MNTGGPAFPVADTYHPNGQVQFGSYGMTLLDWFAGQALTGILADSESQGEPEEFAAAAYNIAESMLAEKARCEALVKESSTTDHSGEAGKMVELEAQNRELVERIKQLEEAGNDLVLWFCQIKPSHLRSAQTSALKQWKDLRGRRNL